jgi:prepilin-type N-terminal cleavage/methylation domain-containing protein
VDISRGDLMSPRLMCVYHGAWERREAGMGNPRDSQAGFGLVEVIVAMLLLAIIAVAILPALWQGIQYSAAQSSTATATRHLNALIEEARDGASCVTLASVAAERTVEDGKGNVLTSSGTVGTCASKTAVPLSLEVRDGSNTVIASTDALVYVP